MSSLAERWLRVYQYVNIATCAAYVVAGWEAWNRVPGPEGLVFWLWLGWLGVSSAIYHARPFSLYALRLDQAGMYGTFVALVIYAVTPHPLAWVFEVALGIAVGMWLAGLDRVTVVSMTVIEPVMVLLGGLTAVAVVLDGTRWMGLTALGLFAVAWVAWQRPWGHGVWHVLTAAAILLLIVGVR